MTRRERPMRASSTDGLQGGSGFPMGGRGRRGSQQPHNRQQYYGSCESTAIEWLLDIANQFPAPQASLDLPNLDHHAKFSDEQKAKFQEAMQNTKSQKLSLRPGFALEESFDAIVYTNHFAIELPTKDMYEYKIEGIVTAEQSDEDRIPAAARRQELMDMAITSSALPPN
jgi:hypothetical protein